MSSPKQQSSFTDEKASDVQLESAPQEAGMMEEPAVKFTAAEEEKLYRRVDWRILPILALLYLLSFLDRGNIGNARGYGLEADLRMSGLEYNGALSAYFAVYSIFEVPANLMLKKLTPAIWLSSITVLWGIVVVAMGFVTNYQELVGCRVALGIAEAGLFPGVILYLTMWYPRHRSQYRIAFFFAAATMAGAFSGLLAFAIGGMVDVGNLVTAGSWRWIFILEGIFTVVCGIGAFWCIVDTPDKLKVLNADEREWIKWKKYSDSGAVGEAEHVTPAFILSALTSWQVWLSVGYYAGIVVPLYSIGLSLPTIIRSFSTYTVPEVQLLTIPVYVVACTWVIICALWSDKKKSRFYFVLANQLLTLVGFAIQITDAPSPAKYFGCIVAASGAYGGLPSVVAWLGGNLMGQTKRGVGMALQIGIGNLFALISSNVYRTQDAPRYIIGHGAILGSIGFGLVCSPLYAYLLTKANQKRDAEQLVQDALPEHERTVYTVTQLRVLGDLAPSFRYTI